MSIVLGLDIGTTSIAALACEVGSGRVVAVRTCSNDTTVLRLPAGCHEQDPVGIRERCFGLLAELLADEAVVPPDVRSIALTGQMHGVLLVDGAGDALTNLVTWRDQRLQPDDVPELVEAGGPGAWREETGCCLAAGYGGMTLRWLAQQGGAGTGCTALSIADYVAFALCGVRATDTTHVASWGIFDVRGNVWHSEALDLLRIPHVVLPEIREGGTLLDSLTAGAAARLGLRREVAVFSPVGDNQASVIGASGPDVDAIVVNLGTGGQVSVPIEEFATHAGLETRPRPGGGYLLVGVSLCGGDAYAHLMRFFRQAVRDIAGELLPEETVYERMNELAAQAGPGMDGLCADTRFAGTRMEPAVRGSIRGIGLGNWTPAHLTRAVTEGMVRELAEQVPTDVIGERIDRVVASGNAAARNPVVRQAIEAAFGRPCEVRNEAEEAARGAAMLACRQGMA